jgi:hypothetical protein
VVERPFDRLTVLPSAMSSLRSELRVEDGPNGATSKDTRFMHVLKQPHRTTSPQRRGFFVPVHGALSALGAVIGSGVFWVAEMKRDPLAPFEVRILRTRPDGLSSDPTLRAGPQFPLCLQRGMNSNLVAFNFIGEYREPTLYLAACCRESSFCSRRSFIRVTSGTGH